MSYPTTLGPWFVVQRLTFESTNIITGVEYYQHAEDGDDLWTGDKKVALMFMSLHHAARVAEAEAAEVRVLSSREDAKEFGRS